MRGSERGSVTLWTMGLAILLLAFGGIAVDLWRALALQRELAAVADAVAVSAASGIDDGHYRVTGEVVVDPLRARELATRYLATQDVDLTQHSVTVPADGTEVSIVVEGVLDLGLVGIFVDGGEPLTIRASSTAEPVLIP